MRIYFDNAATTPVCNEVVDTMIRVTRECYGNPSSRHQPGRTAATELESARGAIADALGADRGEICFTSGGTEANNLAVFGCAEQFSRRGRHIITSAIEHDAILKPMEKLSKSGWEVTYLTPGKDGSISVEAFSTALREDTILATIMLVNNETGAVNPIGGYSAEIKRRGLPTLLHTDAVQGLCKIPLTVSSLGVDLLTISAHKLHGPKGAGALFIRSGVKIKPLLLGGGQEKGMRSGTEALPAIAGFGTAARLGMSEFEHSSASVRRLNDYITGRIQTEIPGAVITSSTTGTLGNVTNRIISSHWNVMGSNSDSQVTDKLDSLGLPGTHKTGRCYSPYILSFSLPGFKSEVLMNYLDSEGICVSNGAACKKGAHSHVLNAMGVSNPVIDGTLRISFSRYNTREEADYFVDKLKHAATTLLKTL